MLRTTQSTLTTTLSTTTSTVGEEGSQDVAAPGGVFQGAMSLVEGARQAERLISNVACHVARMEAVQRDVVGQLRDRPTRRDVAELQSETSSRLAMIERRLERIERATTVGGAPSRQSGEGVLGGDIGSHVRHIYKVIEGIGADVSQRCTGERLEQVRSELRGSVRELATNMQRERASAEQMSRLEEAHFALVNQVEALETSCANKVDVSRLAGLDSTISRLQDFAAFRTLTEERLALLEEAASSTRDELLERAAKADIAAQSIREMRNIIQNEIPRLSHLDTLEQRFKETLSQALASRAETLKQKLREEIALLQSRHGDQLEHTRQQLEEHQQLIAEHKISLSECSTATEVSKKADLAYVQNIEEQLRVAVQRSSSKRTVERLQSDIGKLQLRCNFLDQSSAVFRRFVEWFHKRGSAYEHNFEAIEQQLNSLVSSSDPRPRQPFSGQVRLGQLP